MILAKDIFSSAKFWIERVFRAYGNSTVLSAEGRLYVLFQWVEDYIWEIVDTIVADS